MTERGPLEAGVCPGGRDAAGSEDVRDREWVRSGVRARWVNGDEGQKGCQRGRRVWRPLRAPWGGQRAWGVVVVV